MVPLVDREMEERLLTDWLELIDAEVRVFVRREERASESDLAGNAREELEADEVIAVDREESLVFLWPRSASPRRGCEVPMRPKDGILEPVAGLDVDVVEPREPLPLAY